MWLILSLNYEWKLYSMDFVNLKTILWSFSKKNEFLEHSNGYLRSLRAILHKSVD